MSIADKIIGSVVKAFDSMGMPIGKSRVAYKELIDPPKVSIDDHSLKVTTGRTMNSGMIIFKADFEKHKKEIFVKFYKKLVPPGYKYRPFEAKLNLKREKKITPAETASMPVYWLDPDGRKTKIN